MALPIRDEDDPLKRWLEENSGDGGLNFNNQFKWLKDVAGDAVGLAGKIPGAKPVAKFAKRSATEFNEMIGKPFVAPLTRSAFALSLDAGTIFEYQLADTYESLFQREKHKERTKNQGIKDWWKEFSDQLIIRQLLSGEDLGQGYLPSGSAVEKSQQAIAENRPKVGNEIFTLGRGAAYPLVKLGVIQQDGIIYDIISGGLDARKVMKNPIDPFNQLPRIRPAGTAPSTRVATGGLRVADQADFAAYFDDLEKRVAITRAEVMATGRKMTPQEISAASEYSALTTSLTPRHTRLIPDPTNPGKTLVTTAHEPSRIYSKYGRAVDDEINGRFNTVGLADEIYPALVRNQYESWVASGDATTFAQEIIDGVRSGTTDAGQLWRTSLNREGIQTSVGIVDTIKANPSITTDEVLILLEEGVSSFEPGFNLRKIGRSTLDGVRQNDGNIIKYQLQDKTRQLELLPESMRVGFTDPNQSAANLDNLMGSLGFKLKDRNYWLGEFGRAVSGTKGDLFEFFSRFEENAIGLRLQQANIRLDPKQIRELTSWSGKLHDEVVGYTMDALGKSVPLTWLDGDQIGPLRLTQLMSQDFYLMPVEVLDKLIEVTGKVGGFRQVMKQRGDVGFIFEGYDEMTSFLKAFMADVWKPAAVAKISHTVRVVPEELARGAASGIYEHPIEQILVILGRSAQTDASGTKIASKIPDLVRLYKNLDGLITQIDEAEGYLAASVSRTLTDAEQRFVDRLPDWRKRAADIEAKINTQGQDVFNSVIGPRSRGSTASSTGEYAPLYQNMMRNGQMSLPSRSVARERQNWIRGVIHEITDMFYNDDYRRIAKNGLFDTDQITIGGVRASITQHVRFGTTHPFTGRPIANDLDAVKLWLFQGDGRPLFDSYFNNLANLKPTYRAGGYDNYATASERVDTILNHDIRSVTGLDPILLEVIADGTYLGNRAIIKNINGRGEASETFTEWVKTTFATAPHAPDRIRYFPERKVAVGPLIESVGGTLLPKTANFLDKLYGSYFQGFYGLTSDLLSRVPSWKVNYWSRMEELVPLMSPKEAKRTLDAAKVAKLSEPRLQRIRIGAAMARGENTLEGADQLAKHYATQATNNLYYKSNNRSLFGQQHRITFAFFEAFREVTTTWLKLSAMNPRIIRNVAEFADTAESEGWYYANRDGRNVIEIPLSGRAAQMFFDAFGPDVLSSDKPLIQNFTVGVNAINIIGQGRPGFGPTVQFVVDNITPDTAEWQWFRSFFSPYGAPDLKSPGAIGIFIPQQLKQMTNIVNGTELEPFANFLLGDRDINDYHKKAVIRSWQYLINNYPDKYIGRNAVSDAMDDAQSLANKITFVRGLQAFLGPGAPLTEWIATTPYGSVELSIILEDLYRKEEEARQMGEPTFNGYSRWIEFWGKDVWAYATTLSNSNIGGQIATREFETWAKSNQPLLDKYPLVAGYFGPRGGERNLEAWLSQSETGRRPIRDLPSARAEAEQRMGNYLYYDAKNRFTEEELENPVNRQQLSIFREQISAVLPMWNRPGSTIGEFRERIDDQISELRNIIKDPRLAGDDLVPIIRDYLKARDSALATQMKIDPKVNLDSWYRSKAGRPIRDYLRYELAPYLSSRNTRFTDLFEQVLSYEFTEDEE